MREYLRTRCWARQRWIHLLVSRRLVTTASLMLVLLGVFSSCLPSDPGPAGEVGVKIDGDQITVRVKSCAQRLVESVMLETRGDDHDTLWSIQSTHGPAEFTTPLGVAPKGFTTLVPLTKELMPGSNYALVVRFSGQLLELPNRFDPADLSSDRWDTSSTTSLTDQGFDALDVCR